MVNMLKKLSLIWCQKTIQTMGMLYTIIVPVIIGILFFGYSPTLLDFEPRAYKITTLGRLSGALQVNNRLSQGELLFEGKFIGPESLAVHEGSIYTGTSDGCINKITGKELICFAKLKVCAEEKPCSRPLGIRVHNGALYVADALLGIYSVDINTGSSTPIISVGESVGGKPVTFPDDLSVSVDGVIYFSDASIKWDIEMVGLSVLEHEDSGRIIMLDTKTNTSSVLIDGIFFPNGVQLSKSEDSLLIAEFSNHRILRHYLKGNRKGQTEVFTALPGKPDNIRSSKNGYWISLFNYHNPATSGLMDNLSQYPFIRKVIVRFQQSIGSFLLFINQYWKSQHLESFATELKTCFNWIIPRVMHGMAVEVDENGKFVRSVQSSDGKYSLMSEMLEHNGYLYAGSYVNPYIIRMKDSG